MIVRKIIVYCALLLEKNFVQDITNGSKEIKSSQSYNASKFVSVDTQERYMSYLQIKLIQNKGLIQHLDHNVKKTIKDYKWEVLCDHLDSTVVLVVREFYANGIEQDGFTIMVKRKRVPFDRSTINKYYGLSDIQDDEYQSSVESDGTN